MGHALIVGEVAIALVLLAGAGSFARSLANVTGQAFGFDREHVLVVDIDPALARYDYQRLGPLYEQMQSRLSSLPGVKSASLSYYSPFNRCCWQFSISVLGYTPQPRESTSTMLNRVSPRYFETIGTRLVRGRGLDDRDRPAAPRVAVVNEVFVQRYFQHEDPIGKRFGIDSDGGTPADIEIVGVVENAKYDSPRDEPVPMAFLPLLQVKSAEALAGDDSVFVNAVEVRSIGDPAAMAGQVRQVLAGIDPNLAVLSADTLSNHIDRELNQEHVIAQLAAFFGLLALVLASVGLYGLMAYMVQRRTGEIGVRIALGARRDAVIGMVIREALWQGAVGILVGLPLAFAATRAVANQLYGVAPSDPTYSAIAAGVLLLCISLAGYVPARRASRIDPMRVLSQE